MTSLRFSDSALTRLCRGAAASRVIYLGPGKDRHTMGVRAYLARARFPEGPVLFPEASPEQDLLGVLRKKWPHIEYGITRRPEMVAALRSRDIPVVVVRAPVGAIEPAAAITFVQDWSDVK